MKIRVKQLFITQKNDDITAYYATIAARFMGWGAVLNEYYAKTEYHLFSALSRPAAGIKFAPFYKKRGLIPVAASFDSKMREFMQYGVPSGMIRSNDNQIFARKKLSGPMKKNNRKHVIIVVLFFSLIIAAYF